MLDLGDKRATQSLTVVGAAIFAGLQAAESMNAIPAGVAAQVAAVGQALAFLLAAFGLRRAVGNPVVVEELVLDTELDPDFFPPEEQPNFPYQKTRD